MRKKQRGAYGAAGETFDAAAEAEVAAGNVKSAWRDQFDTSVAPEEAVSNGDQVTVTVTPSYEEEQVTMQSNGLILTGGTKSDTIEGAGRLSSRHCFYGGCRGAKASRSI